jgi:hypothetical protein
MKISNVIKPTRHKIHHIKVASSQVLMAHTCNPSYSGDRDQEDLSSKPAWANSSQTLSQKGLVEWLEVKALSSSPSTRNSDI